MKKTSYRAIAAALVLSCAFIIGSYYSNESTTLTSSKLSTSESSPKQNPVYAAAQEEFLVDVTFPLEEKSTKALSEFSSAAKLASEGKLRDAAEALHKSNALGEPVLKRIYTDSRFKNFIGSPQHAQLLLVLGQELTPEHGFAPIQFSN